MRKTDDLWLLEDLSLDEADEVLSIPEVRWYLAHDEREDGEPLRALLERPDTQSKTWWYAAKQRRRAAPRAHRHPSARHAA